MKAGHLLHADHHQQERRAGHLIHRNKYRPDGPRAAMRRAGRPLCSQKPVKVRRKRRPTKSS